MKQYAIIVAGGRGLRMGSELPKQFLPVGGKPVLMHTIKAFCHYDASLQIILVLPKEQHNVWKKLCREDRKSTRLNSSHANISYAVFCLKKKKILYKQNI